MVKFGNSYFKLSYRFNFWKFISFLKSKSIGGGGGHHGGGGHYGGGGGHYGGGHHGGGHHG